MSEPISAASNPPARKSGRTVFYIVVLILIAAVVGLAWYWEQISYAVTLRTWDRAAPGRTVLAFLEAGKNGDQEKATSHLGTKELQPLVKDGKWLGYFMVTQAGRLEFHMKELAPGTSVAPPNAEFVLMGQGAAEVEVPDSKGKGTKYRLEMTPAGWKIMEIRGGRPA